MNIKNMKTEQKINWDDDCDDYIPIEELIDYDDDDDSFNCRCI